MRTLALAVAALVSLGAAKTTDRAVVVAAREGDAAALRTLIQQRSDVNIPEPDGTTALHWAAHRDDLAMVDMLLRAGADAKKANRYRVTPLALAAETGGAAVIERLLAAGADPKAVTAGGETVLHTAARTGSPQALRVLIAAGADVNAREVNRAQTPIMWAAAEGNAAAIQVLAEAGADVHARSAGPSSGIGKINIYAGRSELEVKGATKYLDLRKDRVDAFTPLLFAARRGQIDAARALIAAGARVDDGVGENGTTPLMVAIINAHWEFAGMLLDAGANPKLVADGWTALHHLARPLTFGNLPNPVQTGRLDNLALMKKLIASGADVSARIDGKGAFAGATPLWLAARGYDASMMRLLVTSGADPSIPSAKGTTVLMAASGCDVVFPGDDSGPETDSLEAVNVALALGIDVNASNSVGDTALHGAAFIGATEVAALLVARGARLDVKNKKGWTPIMTAHLDYVGDIFQSQPKTEALLRTLMQERGLPISLYSREEVRKYLVEKSAVAPQ